MTNENKEVKQKKAKNVIPGTNVSKVGVIVTSVILAVLIAISAFFVVVFSASSLELMRTIPLSFNVSKNL